MDNDERVTVCPTCRREYEEYQGFPTLLCADCAGSRDEIYDSYPTEEEIQEKIKKGLHNK